VGADTDNRSDLSMKFQAFIAIFASIVATSLGMDQPSFHTKGTPTGKPTGPLKPGEYWWKAGLSPRGPVVVLVSLPQQTMHVYRNGNPIGRAALEVKGRRLGEHVFTLLEGVTGKPSQLAPGRQAGRWMRVDGAGNSVTAEKLTSRLQFSPEFAHKVANEIAPGTTVIVTDAPAVRKPVVDSTYFASN
jgi:hypothetical protein